MRTIALALGLLAGSGGDGDAASLVEELRGLIASHPDVRAAESRLNQAHETVREARAPYYPQLGISGDYGYENVDSPVRRAAGGDPVEQSREIGRFEVTQKLFDGLRTDGAVDAAIAREQSAAYGLARTEQQLLLRGTTAYFDVLRRADQLEIARATEAAIQRQLELEDERVRRGSGLSVDVLQAKARLQVAKEDRVAAEGRLSEAVAEYVAVFDHPPAVAAMAPPPPADAVLPRELRPAIDRALAVNPLMLQSNEAIGEAHALRKAARSGFMPDIDVVAEGAMENDAEGIPGNRKELFVGLRAEWELFDGFATAAATRRAGQRIAETMQNHASLSREIARRVDVAWQTLMTLRERQALAENAASIAAELYRARQRLRQAGRESVINVLDAERELNAARSREVAARYDAVVQAYRLLFEIGILELAVYEEAAEGRP